MACSGGGGGGDGEGGCSIHICIQIQSQIYHFMLEGTLISTSYPQLLLFM